MRSLDIDTQIDESDAEKIEAQQIYEIETLEGHNEAFYKEEKPEIIDDSILEAYEKIKQLID